MAKTRAELIDEVAGLLNILGPGETLSAEDQDVIDGKIDPEVARLSAREIVYIADVESIEDEYFDDLAILVAETAGPKFGQGRNPVVRNDAENRLREMGGGSWGEDDVVEATYY